MGDLEAPDFAQTFTNNLAAVEKGKGSTVIIEEVSVSAMEVSSDRSTTQAPVTSADQGGTTITSITPRTTVSPVGGEKGGTVTPVSNKTLGKVTDPASIDNATSR